MAATVLLDGLSGAGKTTVIEELTAQLGHNYRIFTDDLENHSVLRKIEEASRGLPFWSPERSLLCWIRWCAKNEMVRELIVSGEYDIILIDRLFPSLMAYNSLSFTEFSADFWNEYAKLFIKPDLVFIFDIDRDISLQRKNSPSLQDRELFNALRQKYLLLAAKYNWQIVNGNLSRGDNTKIILREIEKLLLLITAP